MPKKASFDPKKVREIDDGMPFAQLPLDLLISPAWCGQSINCRRLIDFLMAEHLRHAGLENGRLIATYDHLVTAGIGRRLVSPSLDEAEARGLACIDRGTRASRTSSFSNRFRLTFFKTVQRDSFGRTVWTAPTHEWRRYKNEIRCNEGEPPQCTKVNFHGSPIDTPQHADTAETADFSSGGDVSKGEPLCISRLPAGDERTDQSSPPHAEPEQQPPAEGRDETHAAVPPAPHQRREAALPRPKPPVARHGISLPVGPATAAAAAARQQTEAKPAPASIVNDPRQIDLVDLLGGKPSSAVAPVDQLRAATKTRLASETKGTHTRLAAWLGISSCTLSNFLSKGGPRYHLNTCAEGRLREWVDGHLDLAPTGDAAA